MTDDELVFLGACVIEAARNPDLNMYPYSAIDHARGLLKRTRARMAQPMDEPHITLGLTVRHEEP